MHDGAAPDGIAFKLDQVRVEIVDDPITQHGGMGANFLPVIDFRHTRRATVDEFSLGFFHRVLQHGIVQFAARRLLEVHAVDLH